MKLKLNKKKLKNLSKDAQILPGNMTPNIAGGVDVPYFTNRCITEFDCGGDGGGVNSVGAACPPNTNITGDWGCDTTGSCGCDSAGGACTVTNTCM